jgi:2-alkyl-3-oxoalkanoate reductase
LLRNGITVRALARFTEEKRLWLPKETDCRILDLLSDEAPDELPSLLNGMDAVLHIATAIPRVFNATGSWDVNNKLRKIGTQRLLDASISVGIGYYVQQSITMRYPDCGDAWIDEDTPLVATGHSGDPDTVTVMESLVKSFSRMKLDWCILRGGTFVGPATFQDDAISGLKSGTKFVPGDGMNYMSFIHVQDMAAAFLRSVQVRPHHAILNIVAEPIRNGEYLDRLADIVGASRPKRDRQQPRSASHRCSAMRAKSVLQWTPQHGIFPSASS